MQTINLEKIKSKYIKALETTKRVVVCAGTGCVASNSLGIYDEILKKIQEKNLNVTVELKKEENDDLYVSKSGCQGFCQMGPLVTIYPEGIVYNKVQLDDIEEIINSSILKNEVVQRLVYNDPVTNASCPTEEEIMFYKKQNRYALKNCGIIDPENINEYIARDGYFAARKACLEMDGASICQEILDSGLRGRGGGGFPTGKKWDLTRVQTSDEKYVVCNSDEGDPGAFMDRSISEGNPHAILEGMIISAMAIGATFGYIYVRTEYLLAVKRMKKACKDAREAGILGQNIFGSGKNFDVEVMEGAGAFVCGEETALMTSIEGKRGEPRPRPPFPAAKGLWSKPTVLNNVETFVNVPQIISKGKDWFSSIGTEKSKGTKVFAMGGKINNSGLVEVPMGTTLREIVYDIGGGIPDNKKFKGAQTGGPSGGCIPASQLDTPIDYDSLIALGSMMGSGGLIIMDETTCMVDIAKFFLEFTVDESCGKCPPCRIGTKRMYEILEKITSGKGEEGDIEKLENLAANIKAASLCGLGQTAPNPVLSTLNHFRHEYEAHINDKSCEAGSCKALLKYVVTDELCKKCGICAKNCPTDAIRGDKTTTYFIEQDKCIKCGACLEKCPFKAISKK